MEAREEAAEPLGLRLARSGARERWWLAALLLAATLLYAVPFWWSLPPGRGWAFDEPQVEHIVPEAFAAPSKPWPARYPPLHRLVLRSVLLPALPLARLASERCDVALEPLLHGLGRAVTIPFALVTLLLVYALARRLGGRRAGALAALAWLGVAPQAYYAKTMNLDAPYLAWFALALHFFLEFRRHGRGRDLVGFALAGGASILTKDQAYGLYLLPTLAILAGFYAAARARGDGVAAALRATFLDARLRLAAAAFALEFALVYRIWNGLGPLVEHVEQMTSERYMGRFREVSNSVAGHLDLALSSGRNVVFCVGWPLLALGLLAAGRRLLVRGGSRPNNAAALLLFPLSYYLTFISVVRYSYDRFLLPVVLVLVVVAARPLADLLAAPRGAAARRLATAAAAVVLAYGVARAAVVDLSMLRDVRVEIERRVAGRGVSIGLAGLGSQLPRVTETAPIQRYRRRACELVRGVDFFVFQPSYSTGELGRAMGERLDSGALGFRRVAVPRFEPPAWLYDVEPASTNLAWINMPTLLYARDPDLPCRGAKTR